MIERKRGGSLTRRDFLGKLGWGAAVLGLYSLWRWDYEAQRAEKLKKDVRVGT